jgi:hypothetical protein
MIGHIDAAGMLGEVMHHTKDGETYLNLNRSQCSKEDPLDECPQSQGREQSKVGEYLSRRQ